MRKIYKTTNGLHEILEGQESLIKPDWIKCELKEDDTLYEFYNDDGTPDTVRISINALEQTRLKIKATKGMELETLTVTTSNDNTFDGNDKARINMLSAIQASDISGVTETIWKLADNSAVLIDLNELKEALALSVQKVGEIIVNG